MPAFDPLAFDPEAFDAGPSPALPTGPPEYPFTLFRGVVVSPQLEWSQGILHATLDCRDLNRGWHRFKAGIPIPGEDLLLPDGTLIDEDPAAAPFGADPATGDGRVICHWVTTYWPGTQPNLDDVRETMPFLYRTTLERLTTPTDVGSFLDEYIGYQDPYARYHLDPDFRVWYRRLAPVGVTSDQAVPAPFALVGDPGDLDEFTVLANISVSWDNDRIRRRVFVRGAAREAQLWVYNLAAPVDAGDEYIDAPGALTADDATAVGTWHLANRWRAFLTGTAEIVTPEDPRSTDHLDGWRVGQTLYAKDRQLARFATHPLDDGSGGFLPAIITAWQARLVAPPPAGSIGITIDGEPLSDFVVGWRSFSVAEAGFAQPAPARIELWITDPAQTITIADLARVVITTDGRADLAYTLTFGDVEPGRLQAEIAPEKQLPFLGQPHVKAFYDDPNMPPGGESRVWFQLYDQFDVARPWAGFPFLLTMLAWGDEDETVVSDEYTLVDDGAVVETNNLGQIYSTVQRAATPTTRAVKWDADAIYIPA